MCESLLGLLAEFSHAQYAVVQKGTDGTQGMDGPPKMSAVVYKRICTTAGVRSQYEITSILTGMRRTVFS